MDLVRELKEVRFELALRGYDCEAVDAFLAKLRGDLVAVHDQNEDAKARIVELEGQIQHGGGSSETEGTLRRTLVLAQRLADETEADSNRTAAELIEVATAEAEQLRTSADVESRGMREAAQVDLTAARNEAESIRVTTNEEAAKNRAEARAQAEAILAEAEKRGVDRVTLIERTAHDEAVVMREPVRTEVAQLEAIRSNLLNDISGLESHLEQQRVRVRTAVEALRVGMSGSIEDLERVAEDDYLMASVPALDHSGARGDDVAAAPDVEIMDRVIEAVPPASSIAEVEDAAIKGAALVDGATRVQTDYYDASDGEAAKDETSDDGRIDGIFATRDEIFAEAALVVDEVDFDAGPNTEPIPVVAIDGDYNDDNLVLLEDEPTALFGTTLGSDVEVASIDDGTDEVEGKTSFVDRFAEALDALPIANDS
ncbi:MAG: DivIVA domain-containing protein [Verrucomicrobiales bacterium]|jgi:DivIVA domain-containing protein